MTCIIFLSAYTIVSNDSNAFRHPPSTSTHLIIIIPASTLAVNSQQSSETQFLLCGLENKPDSTKNYVFLKKIWKNVIQSYLRSVLVK